MTGQGWLRLTPAETYKAGTAFLTTAFPSSPGISVEFELSAYGGKPADGSVGDGVSFYLIDGSKDLNSVGGAGGTLGYANHHPSQPGVNNGYIGIGIDRWGAFSDSAKVGTGGAGRSKNHAVIRGAGDKTTGFPFLTHKPLPTLALTRAKPTRVYLTIFNEKVTVSVGEQDQFTQLIKDYKLPTGSEPTEFKLGLSGTTGAATNIHEIRNFKVTLPTDLSTLGQRRNSLVVEGYARHRYS
ncbi:hypothetical protein GCM10010341_90910 [Streptomyces noursei]|nr:hypothetical protein GCM10010341_90910 [Streptomyces noursei]